MRISKEFSGKLVIFTLIITVFFTPLTSSLFKINTQIITFVVFAATLSLFFLLFPKIKLTQFDKIPLKIAIFSVVLFFISQLFWMGNHNAYSYIGIPIAFIAYLIDFKSLSKYLTYILIISFLLAFYEYTTKSYLFTNIIQRGSEEISLDMKLFAGSIGLMRAKALFYGPLSLAHFAFGIALIFNKNIKILTIALIIAFLSSVRLSIISISVLMIFFLYFSDILSKKNKSITIVIVSIIGLIIIFSGMDFLYPSNIERISNSFNLKDAGNQARILYFYNGIITWSAYSPQHLFFGNNSYYFSLFQNNPESGWVTLLTDNGIIGVLFYLIPFTYCGYKFLITKQFYEFSSIILLFLFLGVVTFHLSATSNLILWLVIFEKINLAKHNTNKYHESLTSR